MEKKSELDVPKENFAESKEEHAERVKRIRAEIESWPDWKKSAIAYEPKLSMKV